MSKKRILFGAAAATVALGAGIGTFAAFSDSDTMDSVSASAGTLYLDGGLQTSTWALADLVPGTTLAPHTVTLVNGGSLPGKLELNLGVNGTPDQEDTDDRKLETRAECGESPECTVTPASELPENLKVWIRWSENGAEPWIDLLGEEGNYQALTPVAGTEDPDDYQVTLSQLDLPSAATRNIEVRFQVLDADNSLQGDDAEVTLSATLSQN